MGTFVDSVRNGVGFLRRRIVAARRLGAVELARRFRRRLVNAYWRRRGTMPITVGATTTRFYSEYPTEIRVLRFLRKYERVVLEDMDAEIEPDDVLFDVGANIGVHTCVGASAGAKVVAFEPYPVNIDRLEANVELNGLTDQVDVRQVALADAAGVADFDRGAENAPGWPWASMTENDNTIQVEKVTGDSLVSDGEIPRPDIVKIDVEGAEPLVIEGLSETLAEESCRVVYCEVHRDGEVHPSAEDFGQTSGGVTVQLEDLGFDVDRLDDREHETYLKGTK